MIKYGFLINNQLKNALVMKSFVQRHYDLTKFELTP